MTFHVAAESYDRFMGRYSAKLAAQMADLAGVTGGQNVLDVGSGTGMLSDELLRRTENVSAIDPSEPFVEALTARHPELDVRLGSAEQLPYEDGTFDAALAQLVVHFMSDPARGIAEMARVTRAGGVVAACVWDHEGDQTPIAPFWRAARELDPDLQDESGLAGGRAGHLVQLFEEACLRDVEETTLRVRGEHPTFEDWWQPFTLGVGPAGAYYQELPPEQRQQIEERCRELLPAPITLETRAWAARGVA
jgi:SAM-dependent methyltransferase